jgi:succinate dehydrogenase/fumarate reductase flavoprotein subunit
MWDPFRYKLGGRLLNGAMEEFTERYGTREDGRYVLARDVATYAIVKEAQAGRGSPHGGAFLSFQHCSAQALRAAFGPVIDRLAKNGIDLTRAPIEVAPIAHYHMGGIRVNDRLETSVPGLFAAGEAVGAANGANRLSGNAVTEALAFGRRAGMNAAALAADRKTRWRGRLEPAGEGRRDTNPAAEIVALQAVMNRDVGPFRTAASLERALSHIEALRAVCARRLPRAHEGMDCEWRDWHDLANLRLAAECVARAALARTESRGAHQREDHPAAEPRWNAHQVIRMRGGELALERVAA